MREIIWAERGVFFLCMCMGMCELLRLVLFWVLSFQPNLLLELECDTKTADFLFLSAVDDFRLKVFRAPIQELDSHKIA